MQISPIAPLLANTVHFDAVIDVQEPVDVEALSGEGTLYVPYFCDYDAYKSFELLLKG